MSYPEFNQSDRKIIVCELSVLEIIVPTSFLIVIISCLVFLQYNLTNEELLGSIMLTSFIALIPGFFIKREYTADSITKTIKFDRQIPLFDKTEAICSFDDIHCFAISKMKKKFIESGKNRNPCFLLLITKKGNTIRLNQVSDDDDVEAGKHLSLVAKYTGAKFFSVSPNESIEVHYNEANQEVFITKK